MKTIKSEQIICVDIDETVILWERDSVSIEVPPISIPDPYENINLTVYPHNAHIKLIKDKKARGATIIAWSQSGYRWAQAVIEAVGLSNHIDLVMSKPSQYIDDLPCHEWMGTRIYLSPKSHYKTTNSLTDIKK